MEGYLINFEQLHRDLQIALLTSLQQAVQQDTDLSPANFLSAMKLCIASQREASFITKFIQISGQTLSAKLALTRI